LHDAGSDAKGVRKRHQESVNMNVEIDQRSAVGTLLNWQGVLVCVPSASISSSEHSTISSTTMSIQPSITISVKNQHGIYKCHNALLEFAVADYFHSENIPDRVVESSRF
jgi:hypothetical protein